MGELRANNDKSIVRFKFIEAMILEHGFVSCYHIERCFNIATAAASRTIKAYKEANMHTVYYDRKQRKIMAAGELKKMFLDIEPAKFLEAAQVMCDEEIIQYKTVLA